MDKGKLIFFGLIGVVSFVIILYALSLGGDDNNSSNDFDVPDLVKSEGKDHYKSRLEKANKNKRPASDDFTGDVEFKTYTDSTLIDSIGESVNDVSVENSKVQEVDTRKVASSSRPSSNKSYSSNNSKTSQIQNKPKPVSSVKPAEPKKKFRGGFGISKNKDDSEDDNKQISNGVENKSSNSFIPLIIEDDITIKDGTNIAFIILEDFYLNGTEYKKNSIAFGKANRGNNFFDVQIYQIKNTDGNLYSLADANLFVFDEKYSRGLQYEGDFNEGIKEGGKDAAVSTSTGKLGVAESGARIIDRVVRNVARDREPSIGLLKGYRIYIKNVE